jgi:hypothetical protein
MNTKTRKIMAMILGLALTISLFGGAAVFAAGTIDVGIAPSAANVDIGLAAVTITASATATVDVTDGLAAYSVKITYDKDLFAYSSIVKAGTPVAGEELSINNDAANGILYIVYICGPATSGPLQPIALPLNTQTALFIATFDAVADGTGDFVIAGIDTTNNFEGADSSIAVGSYGTAASVTVTAAPTYTLGDVNNDSSIDSIDALEVLKADAGLVELTPTEILAGDVNLDSAVDSIDALEILKYDAGLIGNF